MARLPSKKALKSPGVSEKLLLNNTPNLQTELSQYVKFLRKTESVTSQGLPEIFWITKSKEPSTAAKPPHLKTVLRYYPQTDDHLWCWCSCEHFMFNCEYALTQYKASAIIQGNGEAAVMMNPRNIPFLCLSGDTLVRTPKGDVRLDKIQRGDKVTTLFGKRKVKASVMTGVKKSFKIETQRGYSVTGSSEHPLLVFSPETIDFAWKPISQIETGDILVHKLSTRDRFARTRTSNGTIMDNMLVPFERVMNKHVDEEFAKIQGNTKEPIRSILEKFGIKPTEVHITECVKSLEQTYPIPNGTYKSLKGSTVDEVKTSFSKARRSLKLSLIKTAYVKDAVNKQHAKDHLYAIPKDKSIENWLALVTRQDLTFEHVISITEGDDIEMFDIEVMGDHHFIANGLVVHNCKHLYAALQRKKSLRRLKSLARNKGIKR